LRKFTDHKRYETIIQKLRDNGHKITPQRLAIVKILAKSEGYPSVENIHVQIKKDVPTMSLATVYRNIILIKSLGEVLELGFPDGSNRYDGNKPYLQVPGNGQNQANPLPVAARRTATGGRTS
jgi:Fur family peroxide stress response transcriptional regulator